MKFSINDSFFIIDLKKLITKDTTRQSEAYSKGNIKITKSTSFIFSMNSPPPKFSKQSIALMRVTKHNSIERLARLE